MPEVKSTCCYCGVGCGVLIQTEGSRIVGVRGDPDHPANYGKLCTKGSTLHLSAASQDTRALTPELRTSRDAVRQPVSWEGALDYAAARFASLIAEHGPDSVAFYISGQLLTEDYYVFNKLAKGLIGTNNVDTNSRLCMSSAVSGYKTTLGADAPPCSYEDIELADCIFIAGSNMAYAHPILFRRIEAARERHPDRKLIVVDPRRTDTAQVADLHLPILPGTDVALFHGMLHVLLWDGLVDQQFIASHTSGFEGLKKRVQEYTPEAVSRICGVPAEDIVQAARWFGQSSAALSLYCQGLNQSAHGTDKNGALINLHLATGQIGRPGAGPFSLTGQPNAMGGREVGGMATLLSAHRELSDPGHRAEVAALWGVPSVPAAPGKSAVEMFEALRSGEIKAVWIACTNPAHSMPDANLVREALEHADFVVVQEAFRTTDTVQFADLLLPAATWGEKEGTVTNSERRITRVRQAVTPPGMARPDWEIVVDFAHRLDKRLGRGMSEHLFPYLTPEAIFNEHRESTRGRDLDITGLSYALLEEQGPQQWPFPEGASRGKERLYGDGVFPTPDGRARFRDVDYQGPAEAPDARFPLSLNTGRLRDQWHGMSRTGLVGRLFAHVEEPLLSMNPRDLQARGLKEGQLVKVKSRRGELVVRIQPSEDVRPGQVFMPMHWGSAFMTGTGCNGLTIGAIDPVSRQPELKHCAVQVEAVALPWRLEILRKGDATRLLEAIQPWVQRFEYAHCGLYGRDEPLVFLSVAARECIGPEALEDIDRLLGMSDPASALTYADSKKCISKRIQLEEGEVAGVRLTGETAARNWLREVMLSGFPLEQVRRWALAPVHRPPEGGKARGRIVCNCMDVSEQEIVEALEQGADLASLQAALKCGTQCGSCLPEVRRMVGEAGSASTQTVTADCGSTS